MCAPVCTFTDRRTCSVMDDQILGRSRAVWWRIVGVCLLAALSLLWGCAGKGAGSAGGGRTDLLTESDESGERKRARIRLELAVGYFEQGKTAIALDEIKQAIAADPGFSDAYSLRGLIYMRLNEYGLAEESFNLALGMDRANSAVLHNLGWLKCQQGAFVPSFSLFQAALAQPQYAERAKTLRALGLCQERAGDPESALVSLQKSYELDAGNPVTGYNLANLLLKKGDLVRSQFYIRRLNNSELANAESLWLGIKLERRIGNNEAVRQLGVQLQKRYPESEQAQRFGRGAFDD